LSAIFEVAGRFTESDQYFAGIGLLGKSVDAKVSTPSVEGASCGCAEDDQGGHGW